MIPMPKKINSNFGSKYYNILSSFEDLMKIALEARKNKDLKTLKDIKIPIQGGLDPKILLTDKETLKKDENHKIIQ